MHFFLEWLNRAHFNFYDLLLIMIIVQCTMFSSLLVCRRAPGLSHTLLSAFIASLALGQIVFLLTYNPAIFNRLNPVIGDTGYGLLALTFYLHGPLLYHYVRALTAEQYPWCWQYAVPGVVCVVLVVIDPLHYSAVLQQMFWRPFVLVGVVGFLLSVCYGVATLAYIRQYSQRLRDRFCTIDTMEYGWLRVMSWGFVVVWVIEVLPPFFYPWAPWWLQQWVTHLPGLLELMLVCFVVFSGLFYARFTRVISEPKAVAGADECNETLAEQIRERMVNEQLYAQPRLNVERLATQLGLPARQLSHIINRHFNKNFYEFINDYRIAEVKIRLGSEQWRDRSVQEIYESVGFRSRSSFFTLFRKQVGVTPSQYRDQAG